MTEQWPLHTAWILDAIKDDHEQKGNLSSDQNSTIIDAYELVKKDLYSDEMDELISIDFNHVKFKQFIQKQPTFTVRDIHYLLSPLTFNLNPAVRSEITKYKAQKAENYVADLQINKYAE